MESKSAKIYNFLEHKIAQGEYKPGDRLPSESELCTEFKVSRGPVRAALDQLMAIGLVFKKKGGGSYVREQDSSQFLNSVLPSLRFNTNDYREILELRCALDKVGIELCLENHSRNDYSELDAVMSAMEKKHSIEEFFSLDRTFHTIISSLSGNRLLHNVNLMIWDLLKHCPKEEYYSSTNTERVEDHRNIYKSIKENDVDLAVLYALRHLKRMMGQEKKNQDPASDAHRWNPWLYDTL
jgi:GntR family transcriptional regulator, transcriptional repressor for pyruvate dehydrogenase complex